VLEVLGSNGSFSDELAGERKCNGDGSKVGGKTMVIWMN